ncbi:MAG: hypothetical protein ABI637_04575 [Gemmatimonadota bacterium]
MRRWMLVGVLLSVGCSATEPEVTPDPVLLPGTYIVRTDGSAYPLNTIDYPSTRIDVNLFLTTVTDAAVTGTWTAPVDFGVIEDGDWQADGYRIMIETQYVSMSIKIAPSNHGPTCSAVYRPAGQAQTWACTVVSAPAS